MSSFIQGRIRAVGYAAKGAFLLLKNEASIKVQATIAIAVTIAGCYFELSTTEWIMQVFAIGLVMTAEGLNTAIEEMANFIHPDFNKKIGYIKDVAAGGVFFAAIVALILGCLIYYPKF